MKLKILAILFAIKNFFSPDLKEKKESHFKETHSYKIERVGWLPDTILESSGLEVSKEGKTYWTQGDGGNKNQLYEIDQKGNVYSVLALQGIRNIDWEELTRDDSGNIYVCDIGNNSNKRTDLSIYKVNPLTPSYIDTLRITYEDQVAFPPEKKNLNYDCEAVFWYNHHLYLISKNRGKKWVRIYAIPDHKGSHIAHVTDSIYMNSQITAGDISPDKKMVALLSYGKIYFLKTQEGDLLKLVPYRTRKFNRSAESEAILFINSDELLITNEDRQIFLMKKRK